MVVVRFGLDFGSGGPFWGFGFGASGPFWGPIVVPVVRFWGSILVPVVRFGTTVWGRGRWRWGVGVGGGGVDGAGVVEMGGGGVEFSTPLVITSSWEPKVAPQSYPQEIRPPNIHGNLRRPPTAIPPKK